MAVNVVTVVLYVAYWYADQLGQIVRTGNCLKSSPSVIKVLSSEFSVCLSVKLKH